MACQTGTGIYQGTVDQDSLPGYGPVIFVNRLMRTRMLGGVGSAGEKPAFTRCGVVNRTFFHKVNKIFIM